jgi:N-acetylglucosaminyldiphosphoundecaprenol N-acetyl-beta-D-mannosaminyltransferase
VRAVSLSQAADEVVGLAVAGQSALVVTPNIQHVSLLEQDQDFAAAYATTDYQYADGWPVVWAGSLLGRTEVSRVTGYELLPAALERAARLGVPTAFVGGRPGTDRAGPRLRATYPGLPVVHMEAAVYDAADAPAVAALAARLHASQAALVVLGLGPPKQELLGAQLVSAGCGVVLCVGSAMEVAAGTNRRAPLPFQRLRIEWLYRMAREPRRLIGRYLRTFPHFVVICVRQWRAARKNGSRD